MTAATDARTQAATDASRPLGPDELRLIDAYWRAANYLSVGQIYLMDNPLLAEPLAAGHIKPRLPGPAPTPGSTARTPPRSPAGRGRSDQAW